MLTDIVTIDQKKKSITSTAECTKHRTIQYKISPEEMWSCDKGNSQNLGIEGYEIAKQYYDYYQVKWYQERKKILTQHKRVWPPTNWLKLKADDKLVPPHRPNFIEDCIKWTNSFIIPKKIR